MFDKINNVIMGKLKVEIDYVDGKGVRRTCCRYMARNLYRSKTEAVIEGWYLNGVFDRIVTSAGTNNTTFDKYKKLVREFFNK